MENDFYLEIRVTTLPHFAEGTCEHEPSNGFIKRRIRERGYQSDDIDIHYDDLFKRWNFVANDITKIEC